MFIMFTFFLLKSLDYLWIAYIIFSNSSTWCLRPFPSVSAFPTPYFCVLFNMAFFGYSDLSKVPFCFKPMVFSFSLFLASIFLLGCLSPDFIQISPHRTWFLKGYCNTLFVQSLLSRKFQVISSYSGRHAFILYALLALSTLSWHVTSHKYVWFTFPSEMQSIGGYCSYIS